jgi:hypothetical protein
MNEFETETDLCRAFLDGLPPDWTAYPETAGWDVLLVRNGVQVGIQAKLRANQEVLLQALPTLRIWRERQRISGPRYRGILVERTTGRTEESRRTNLHRFAAIARHLRLLVLRPPTESHLPFPDDWLGRAEPNGLNRRMSYQLVRRARPTSIDWRWYRWNPSRPEDLPPVVPRVPAGVPSPEVVSLWSVAAVRLELLCRERGFVTARDAREIRDDLGAKWNPSTLLKRFFEHRPPPRGRWVLHSRWLPPSRRHPGTAVSLGITEKLE